MPESTKSLAAAFPLIALEWHSERNGNRSPEDVGCYSKEKAWWRCSNDPSHEWEMRIDSRIKKPCPFCSIIPLSLLTLYPDVARQLHPTKNENLNPALIHAYSKKKLWWQCDKSSQHCWDALVCSRTRNKSGCPFCRGLRVDAANSLMACYPEIASEWHPTKNDGLRPEDVTRSSHKKVWWMCDRKHEWQGTVNGRTNQQSGCPFCGGKFLAEENRISVRFPEIAAEWHPTKNRKLRPSIEGSWSAALNFHLSPADRSGQNRKLQPSDVSYGSKQLIWWQCKHSKEHVWKALVCNRRGG